MSDSFDLSLPVAPSETLRAWERPLYSRVRAGDAEIGANPDTNDGGFTGGAFLS